MIIDPKGSRDNPQGNLRLLIEERLGCLSDSINNYGTPSTTALYISIFQYIQKQVCGREISRKV